MSMKKRLKLKPTLIMVMALLVLCAGGGTALALTQNSVSSHPDDWLGTASVSVDGEIDVTAYTLGYDTELENVETVTLTCRNNDGSDAHTFDVNICITDGSTSQATASASDESITAGQTDKTVLLTLSSAVALADVVTLNIVVHDDGDS